MSRKKIFALLGLVTVLTVAGCGKNEKDNTADSSASTTAEQAEADAESEAGAEDEDIEETEEALDPITPSDYLIENISDYVTLGELTGLEVTQYNYEITDELVQEEIDNDLFSYAEEVEVDRASQAGDVVYVDVTSTVQGADDSESSESTYFTIGEEEYGAEFDEQLTGVSADDTLEFSITFDDDIWLEEWVDQTVDFEITVTSVCETSVPEYNDDFVAEYTDYSTTDEYEASVREYLESEYSETSMYEAVETLFEAAAEQCVFSGYPQELYDSSKEELLAFYSMFTGTSDEADIYDLFDITEEDIDAEVLETVNRRLLISAICQENDLDITEEEYVEYLTDYAESYGYDSVVEFETDNSRESLVWSLFESKAGEFLYENAEVTEETADIDTLDEEYDDEDEEFEDEDFEDEDFEDEDFEDEDFEDEEALDFDVTEDIPETESEF